MSLSDRDYLRSGGFTPPPPSPNIFANTGRGITWLLAANLIIWFLLVFIQDKALFLRYFALNRHSLVHANIWQFVTYMFLHISPWHLFFNLLVLFIFGRVFENMWGSRNMILFYFITGIGAGLFSVPLYMFRYFQVNGIIGASGAICGLLYAYARYFPERQILVFFVLPVKMKYFIPGLILISFLSGISGDGNIAHFTHIWGILTAHLYFKYFQRVMAYRQNLSIKKEIEAREKEASYKIKKNQIYDTEIDPILKKISQQGMQSLTIEERKILESAGRFKEDRRL
ncbi:MAG: rhomboid family intramembrane serine protease [bacterium]